MYRRPILLASVRNPAEAKIVLDAGADIIDLKEPAQGALGAVPHAVARAVVQLVGGRVPVSATIGDLPMQPQLLLEQVQAMAATGVDIVKIGLFACADLRPCIRAMSGVTPHTRLVAVCFADQDFDLAVIDSLAEAGFYGAMLDTANKGVGSLRQHRSDTELQRFVDGAHARALLVGLAGSLRLQDVEPLLPLGPDYLGFRGALCDASNRIGTIDADAVRRVSARVRGAPVASIAAAAG